MGLVIVIYDTFMCYITAIPARREAGLFHSEGLSGSVTLWRTIPPNDGFYHLSFKKKGGAKESAAAELAARRAASNRSSPQPPCVGHTTRVTRGEIR